MKRFTWYRRVVAAAAGLLALQAPAIAQEYPNRAITIVCPFGPGTAIDIIGRQLAQHMTGTLGQSVIVDNRAGATGNIATDYVAKSKPDGYTIFITSTSLILNHFINRVAAVTAWTIAGCRPATWDARSGSSQRLQYCWPLLEPAHAGGCRKRCRCTCRRSASSEDCCIRWMSDTPLRNGASPAGSLHWLSISDC